MSRDNTKLSRAAALVVLLAPTVGAAIVLPARPAAVRVRMMERPAVAAGVDVAPAVEAIRQRKLAEHTQRLDTALSAQSSVRHSYRRGSNRVPNGATAPSARPDLSALREVLFCSVEEATITVEPGVTMEELVAAALPRGLLPKVVPEFCRITVGGAIMGGAMESSSFAHGLFHETVSSCELRLPNGTVVTASRSVNPELLAALGGSYGTLASLTAATIECARLPTRGARPPRAALTFEWHADVAEGVAAVSAMALTRARHGVSIDFLDAVALPPSSGPVGARDDSGGVLVCTACLVDDGAAADGVADGVEDRMEEWSVDAAGDEFFYEKLLDCRRRLAASGGSDGGDALQASAGAGDALQAKTIRVSMGLEHYLFRYDRGAFQIGDASLWLARWHDWLTPTKLALALAAARTPFNVRALCDRLFAADTMYRRLHMAPPEAIASRLILQDLFVPAERAAAAIALCRERLTEPPCAIWLWPVRGASDSSSAPAPLAPNGHVPSTEVLLNLGIYTRAPASAPGGAVGFTKALEAWGLANGCRKLLYSANYYESDAMWATSEAPHMYERGRYDALRELTGASESGHPRIEERVLSVLRPARERSPLDAASVALVEWLL